MKCLVCNSTITGQYYQDYWGNKVCQSHIDNHEVTFCISCGSFVRIGDVTGDGRTLCESCMASVISDAEQVDKDIAEKALAKGIDTVVFDRGGYVYHGRVSELAAGAREGGLKF